MPGGTARHSSLNVRILLTAGVVLVVFLGGAGLAINHVFRETALASIQEGLKARIFMLLSAADLDGPANKVMPEPLQDPALAVPDSGQYAQIFDEESGVVWRSRSMLGLAVESPPQPQVGEFLFEEPTSSTGEPLLCLAYGVEWETRGKSGFNRYVLQTCEARGRYELQVARFQGRLWAWFGFLATLLLLVQTLILRWGLRPLREVALEVRAIEAGRQKSIVRAYPRELRALIRNLNALIAGRDSHVQRYRNALGDLAHSLKTPLAVARSVLDQPALDETVRQTLREQINQLDDTVRYQLQRAATVGRHVLAPPLDAAPVLQRIAGSLRKVYHARQLLIEVDIAEEPLFYGNQGDLMEVVGNLADNACKWAHQRVVIRAHPLPQRIDQRRRSLEVVVEDDGPGMSPNLVAEVSRRGLRLDEAKEGQGIGLSVVRDIVEHGYGGRLHIESVSGRTQVHAIFDFD